MDESRSKLKATDDEWKIKFQETSALYCEKLRLEAPAVYWKNIAATYTKKGRQWVTLSCIVAATAATAIAMLLYIPPRIFETDRFTAAGIRAVILIAFAASLIVYVLHLFVRLATSAYHLSRDALEREQLTYVFLALIKEKAIEEADRNIVLSAIFSRSDTGLIKGEGAPVLPGTLGAAIEMFKGPKS